MPDIFDAVDDTLPKYISDHITKQTFILELSSSSMLFLAQAAHIYLAANPQSKMGINALKEMNQQCDIVYNVPTQHGVYGSVLTMPPNADIFPQVVYVPVDHD